MLFDAQPSYKKVCSQPFSDSSWEGRPAAAVAHSFTTAVAHSFEVAHSFTTAVAHSFTVAHSFEVAHSLTTVAHSFTTVAHSFWSGAHL